MPAYDYEKVFCAKGPTSPDGYIWMPIIKIWLIHGKYKHRFGAVVDSGADHTTLPCSLAPAFGLDAATGQPVEMNGISGQVIGYYHEGFQVKIADHTVDLPVLFSPGLTAILLGRHKVFEYFKVSFDQKLLKIRLDPQR